jgi:hypothetical protein
LFTFFAKSHISSRKKKEGGSIITCRRWPACRLGREDRRADREEADVQQEVAREVFLGLPQG